LMAVALLVPAGLGLGDVKLGLLLGLVLGWNSLELVAGGLLLGTLCGAAFALVVATIARTRTVEIPYGPALCLGALVAIVWSEQLGLV
jgi:leader peptidase (prepilin peptidase) / N-methyltransferase